jgi:oxalate decarboxylase/phosphoglucose isomerase-like protein (cupin superfamily)
VTCLNQESLQVGTEILTIRVSTKASGGALFAADVTMPPGGGPPMMHRHAPGELYLVRSGEFVFYLQDEDGQIERRVARAGDVVPIAGGVPHSIRNESDAEAIAFGVYAPGAEHEEFARAAAAMTAPDIEAVLALAGRHGIEMTGPIPR